MPERLTDCLVANGLLSRGSADEALERQVLMGGALDTALFELGLVDEAAVLEGLRDSYGLEVATPADASRPPDERALRSLPERWALKHRIAPLTMEDGGETLSILTPAPADVQLVVRLSELLEVTLRPLLAPEFRVEERLAILYGLEPDERHRALIASFGGRLPTVRPKPLGAHEDLDFAAAVARLRDPKSRDHIARTALRHIGRDLDFVALFIVHDGYLEGWMARGGGADNLAGASVSVDPDSAFRVVLDTRAHYLGPLANDTSHQEFVGLLGRPHPRSVLIVPLRIQERTVALLYAENGPREIPSRVAADVMLFVSHVQGAILTLLLRRKAASFAQLPASATLDLTVPPEVALPVPVPADDQVSAEPTVSVGAPDELERGQDTVEPVALYPAAPELNAFEPEPHELDPGEPAATGLGAFEPESHELDPGEPAATGLDAFEPESHELDPSEPAATGPDGFEPEWHELDSSEPAAPGLDTFEPEPHRLDPSEPASAGLDAFEPEPQALDSGEPAAHEQDSVRVSSDLRILTPAPEVVPSPEARLEVMPSPHASDELIDQSEAPWIEPPPEHGEDGRADDDPTAEWPSVPIEDEVQEFIGQEQTEHDLVAPTQSLKEDPEEGSTLDSQGLASLTAEVHPLLDVPHDADVRAPERRDSPDPRHEFIRVEPAAAFSPADLLGPDLGPPEEDLVANDGASGPLPDLDLSGEPLAGDNPAAALIDIEDSPAPLYTGELELQPQTFEPSLDVPEALMDRLAQDALGPDDSLTPRLDLESMDLPDVPDTGSATPLVRGSLFIQAEDRIERPETPSLDLPHAEESPDLLDEPPELTRATGEQEGEEEWEPVEIASNQARTLRSVEIGPALREAQPELGDEVSARMTGSMVSQTRPLNLPEPSVSAETTPRSGAVEIVPAKIADLQTEAWLQASSESLRPRPLPAEVVERASLPPSEQWTAEHEPQTEPAEAPGDQARPAPYPSSGPANGALAPAEATSEPSLEPGTPAFEAEVRVRLTQLEHPMNRVRSMAREALAAMGAPALPLLAERFPGPLTVNPFAPEVVLPSFADCGPVLSLMSHHGRDAHPYVQPQLDAPDPVIRFFATYFYSAVYMPEAVPRLVQRLHDEEARICMTAARTLFGYRSHSAFRKVREHLHGRLNASSIAARRHATFLLGLFRDVTAIPDLIEILERRERALTDVAEAALAEITKQRLGSNPRKWRAWWAKNEDRNRIEWLIEGLASREPAIRKSACEELRAVTGQSFEYDPDAPRRKRDDARRRWQEWWRNEGRAQA